MEICIVGTGYVGLVTGACLAEIGHRVVCVDDDREKIATLKRGELPIFEPGLDNLVTRNRGAGRLSFTADLKEGIEAATVIFICVGTPPLEDGDADLSAVEQVARRIGELSSAYKLVVEKSTVPVQTGMWIEKTLKVYGGGVNERFDVASNPEFLREGSAVEDFLHPDRIVVGVEHPRAERLLRELYEPILHRAFTCPIHSKCEKVRPVPFLVTDIKSAELIKHASNSFLATKISFMNSVADLCELVGADVELVAEGMGLDRRIGRAFLNAGLGFGGFCFPKDLQAFVKIAEKCGYDFGLLREVDRINQARIAQAIKKLKDQLWILKEKVVGVWGLAFKPDTDDVRYSPALALINRLLAEGVAVKAYDPKAMERALQQLPSLVCCQNPYEVASGADALVVATEWKEFANLDLTRVKSLMRRPLILDGRNLFDRQKMKAMGFEYLAIGR
ncbi:UDP-glucose/GDP-mannose dehydrogenase family protein [Candidatus Methylomirabilis sp.]|uniref:UDP-glucose dehydrogenase family protein n=1 Tax=Candidatus Methylomirabilis sp. TaxID=2032687 RepID=UPI002A5D357F|nr:UDP-glucose/GDP-mannose dehydrogenase family protein [Candidatus Methylomirabilis sp.]